MSVVGSGPSDLSKSLQLISAKHNKEPFKKVDFPGSTRAYTEPLDLKAATISPEA